MLWEVIRLADREKVIDALKRCESYGICNDEQCPYYDNVSCLEMVRKDALSLLKAQKPRVMPAEELRQYLMVNENGLLSHDQWQELRQRAPLYIEFRRPHEYQVNWRTAEHLRPWAMESMFWDNYNKDRRCWTSRPTDSERKNTPWE